MLSFGKLIEQRRKELKLSLRKVAEAIGVSASYLFDVENGRRAPVVTERLKPLAKALDLKVSQLVLAASMGRGSFELPVVPNSELSAKVGAALQSHWRHLSERQLKDIYNTVRKG